MRFVIAKASTSVPRGYGPILPRPAAGHAAGPLVDKKEFVTVWGGGGIIRYSGPDEISVEPIARVRSFDNAAQSLVDHLNGVATRTSRYASKLGLTKTGYIAGILHDVGKHSSAFGRYLRASAGIVDGEPTGAGSSRVDHSTSGAQLAVEMLAGDSAGSRISAEAVALVIASHHSRGGLLDVLLPNSSDPSQSSALGARLDRDTAVTHLEDVRKRLSAGIRELLEDHRMALDAAAEWETIRMTVKQITERTPRLLVLGLVVRFLFSCLIDADRSDSADFEDPSRANLVHNDEYPSWRSLIEPVEKRIRSFPLDSPLSRVRSGVAAACLESASKEPGLYYLSVPTGGGKTLSALRFALHHASRHDLERIIFVLPYTSIIDQNAEVVRALYRNLSEKRFSLVLEHHSNLAPENDSDEARLLAENWDAPIVFTTMVQFLDAFFAAGTQPPRRLHRLAKAVVVFDEIQALPIKATHMFNNAVRFLTELAGATVVLCTATQPLLHAVDASKGAIPQSPADHSSCLVSVDTEMLRRTCIVDRTSARGINYAEIAMLAADSLRTEYPSVLIVVNTKRSALEIYRALQSVDSGAETYHLSTSMCPAHRKHVLDSVQFALDHCSPMICVSTQLIEAGVDLDFGIVIRALAGLDSIAQAAGRCNRHATRATGTVYVVKVADERLGNLRDIRDGIDAATRVLHEFRENPAALHHDLLSAAAMERYYRYYFHLRSHLMDFPIPRDSDLGRDDSILELLSTNRKSKEQFQRVGGSLRFILPQSFATAAREFAAIETNTRGVLVQYGQEARNVIAALSETYDPLLLRELVRASQQFTVNLPAAQFEDLTERRTFPEVRPGLGIHYAPPNYYGETGLALVQESTLWA